MNFTWFDHVTATVLTLLIPWMSFRSAKISDDSFDMLPAKKHLFYTNGLMLIIGALIILTAWNLSDRPWTIFTQWRPYIDSTSIILIAAIGLIYGFELLKGYWNKEYKYHKVKELQRFIPLTWSEYKHYIFLAFAAGIAEETIYRGFLITYFQNILSSVEYANIIAIIIPALAFAISHSYQGWSSVSKIFAIAVLLGGIYVQTGSLALAILIHILIDLISGLVGIGFVASDTEPIDE